MFYKKQVKHLLELLKTPSAWGIEYEPMYFKAPRSGILRESGRLWTVFKLKDSEFLFKYCERRHGFNGGVSHIVKFPQEYNIELTWWEKRAIVKAIDKIFKIAQKEAEQEKRIRFLKSLLK